MFREWSKRLSRQERLKRVEPMRGLLTRNGDLRVAACFVALFFLLSCSGAPEKPEVSERVPMTIRSPSRDLAELVREMAPYAQSDVTETEIPDAMVIRMGDLSPKLTPRQRGQLLQSVLTLRVNISEAVQSVSFSDADLRGARLAGKSLAERLEGKNFVESYADREYQSGVGVTTADLSGVDLRRSMMDGVDLHGADLSGARLVATSLRHANLQGTILNGADLRSADLRGADLRGAYLTNAKLDGVQIVGAKLDGAHGVPSGLSGE